LGKIKTNLINYSLDEKAVIRLTFLVSDYSIIIPPLFSNLPAGILGGGRAGSNTVGLALNDNKFYY
jgi:hypothetical protein